jgi:CHAT domain-containing protein/Tfp pilus assembly protein PilF
MKLPFRLMSCLFALFLLMAEAFGQNPANPEHASIACAPETVKPGVVVEEAGKNSEAERAGMRDGDILLHWVRGDSHGEVESPFDLSWTEIEEAPLGIVKLEGLRGTEKQVWSLGPADWGLTARPNFGGQLLSAYVEAQELDKSNNADEIMQAAARWKDLVDQCPASQAGWIPAWLFFHAAESLREVRRWKEADDFYQSAVQHAAGAGPVIEGQLLRAWAKAYQQRSDWANAERYFEQATAKIESSGEGKLAIAVNLNALGWISWQRGQLDKSEEYLRRALQIGMKQAPGSLDVAASLKSLGVVAWQRGDLVAAEQYYQQALEIRMKQARGSLDVATSLNSLGNVAWKRGDLAQAEQYYRQALEIQEKQAPGSLDMALSLNNLGNVAWKRGDLAQAEQYYRQALEIQEKQALGSLDMALSLNNLGSVALSRGDLGAAEQFYRQGFEIREKQAPGSLDVAGSLNNLGVAAWKRGDLAQAEQYYRQALDIREKQAPGSLDVARSLNNLGGAVEERGDLAQAEQYYRQALEIREKQAPGSLEVASSLNNLGTVAEARGDLAAAEQYYRQALAIKVKQAPGSLDVAAGLNNLGMVAEERGDLAVAEQYYRQALAIKVKRAPGSLDAAAGLTNLGMVAEERGDLAQAEQHEQQAFAIYEKLAPESLETSEVLRRLGDVTRKSGDMARAEQYYRRASAIQEKLAPGSKAHAESLAALASVLREQRQPEAAAQFYAPAITALESQTAHLGGSEETRSGFRANHFDIYREYVDLLVEQKQMDRALEVLERSRARILLETLAAAKVDIHKGANPSLLERERSLQELLTAKSDWRLRLLGDNKNEKQVAGFTQEIEGLDKQYQEVEERLRQESPSYAALTQAHPLSAHELQLLLDDNTLLLEYSLGEERSYVFAVSSTSVTAYQLPRRAEIEYLARNVYGLLTARDKTVEGETERQREKRWANADAQYAKFAARLSQAVLGPVAGLLEQKRLLIVSDGALQYIPFAALPIPKTKTQMVVAVNAPLALEHEIVNLPSASVLAELRRERINRVEPPKLVAVLADPVFEDRDERVQGVRAGNRNPNMKGTATPFRSSPDETSLSSDVSSALLTRSLSDLGQKARSGKFYLSRLPYTRKEAMAILAVTPAGQGMEALDFQANRARAMDPSLGQYRIVHFATHGLLNNRHPELSGLVLSLVDKRGKPQDGFLELQDVYNLNLPVDLVVLSGCETGLGEEINGEGLIGLTRGFMYAGASRVVASLWSVSDEATAELMARFYKAMEQEKMPPAAALRAAQRQMWRQKVWRAPYYWAAFQIQGEWK